MGLRIVAVAVLAFGLLLALVPAVLHRAAPWPILAGYCALGIIAILIERSRYRPRVTGGNYVATEERYRDPVSGDVVRVYADRATGLRDYRPEPKR